MTLHIVVVLEDEDGQTPILDTEVAYVGGGVERGPDEGDGGQDTTFRTGEVQVTGTSEEGGDDNGEEALAFEIDMTMVDLLEEVLDELDSAQEKFSPFNSAHEGFAVLQEEVDELWEEVKRGGYSQECRDEAIQVAAMALRFLFDIPFDGTFPT